MDTRNDNVICFGLKGLYENRRNYRLQLCSCLLIGGEFLLTHLLHILLLFSGLLLIFLIEIALFSNVLFVCCLIVLVIMIVFFLSGLL